MAVSEDGESFVAFACDAEGDLLAGCAGKTPTEDYDPLLIDPIDPGPMLPGGRDAATLFDQGAEVEPPSRRQDRKASKAAKKAERVATRCRRRWPKVALIVTLVMLLLGGAAYAATQLIVPSHEVPELTGLTEEQARALISQSDWKVRRLEGRSDDSTPGEVLSQDPAPKEKLKEGKTVTITVSLGHTLVDVPQDLAGCRWRRRRRGCRGSVSPSAIPRGNSTRSCPGTTSSGWPRRRRRRCPRATPSSGRVRRAPPRIVPDVVQGGTFEAAAAALAGQSSCRRRRRTRSTTRSRSARSSARIRPPAPKCRGTRW